MNIGDKVLCINDRGYTYFNKGNPYMGIKIPKVGEVYTIREKIYGEGLLLEEIVNGMYPFTEKGKKTFGEPAFLMSRFMPWNPEEEEISIIEERVLVNP